MDSVSISTVDGVHVETIVPDDPGFVVIGTRASINGVQGIFSSHMAAFEACMRIRKPQWRPHSRETFFTESDTQTFNLMCAQHAERT